MAEYLLDINWWCINLFVLVKNRLDENLETHLSLSLWLDTSIQPALRGITGNFFPDLFFSFCWSDPSAPCYLQLSLGAILPLPCLLNLLSQMLLSRAPRVFLSILLHLEFVGSSPVSLLRNTHCPLYSFFVSLWTYRVKNDDFYLILPIFYLLLWIFEISHLLLLTKDGGRDRVAFLDSKKGLWIYCSGS